MAEINTKKYFENPEDGLELHALTVERLNSELRLRKMQLMMLGKAPGCWKKDVQKKPTTMLQEPWMGRLVTVILR